MSGRRVRIVDDGAGRLHVKWFTDDSVEWFTILGDFKQTFCRHWERSYSATTKTWSLPERCRERLQQWCDRWFDSDCQQWDDEEPAGSAYGSRTYSHGRSGYGGYQQQASTGTVEGAYRLLCLTPDAPAELVKTVHHWWVRALHPDTGHGDTTRMATINAAVDVIRAERERKKAS